MGCRPAARIALIEVNNGDQSLDLRHSATLSAQVSRVDLRCENSLCPTRRAILAIMETNCPCGSGIAYVACCGPFHSGTTAAPTALELMRSRYSAFAVRDAGYLLETWHPTTRLSLQPAGPGASPSTPTPSSAACSSEGMSGPAGSLTLSARAAPNGS